MSEKRLVSNFLPAGGAFDPLANFETVTYTGNGSTKKVNGYIRKGAAFNGSSSKIVTSIPSSTFTSDFSASFWFNPSNVSTSSGEMPISFLDNLYIQIYLSKIRIQSYDTNYDFIESSTLNNGTWYHFLVTRSGNNYEAFLNGSSIGTMTSATLTTATNAPNIGNYSYNNTQYYNGKIDQVRIFNKELDQDEVDDLYDEDYDSSTKSTTDIFDDGSGIALYEFEDSANDTDGVDGKFNNAAIFNGSSSYIDINAKIPASLNFSVSFWFNSTSGQANGYIFSTKGNSATNGWWIVWNNTSNQYKINYGEGNGSLNAETITTSMTLNDGNWHHIVVTRAAGGTVNIYVDGNVDQQNASVGANYMTSSTWNNDLYIGRYSGLSPALYYNGLLDQIRIYDTALDSDDVAELYAESADVPTANLVAHYKLDGNANDQKGNYNGTASNVTYTGYNGTPTNVDFLGMAFQPDFVWTKPRSYADSHQLWDTIRGAGWTIYSNTTNAENPTIRLDGLSSFDSNGFTVGNWNNINVSGETYVAWCWKAGGTVSANNNTNGDITSTVSANQAAGFSIVEYTGNGGTTQSVGHGLSSAPELVLFKRTDAAVNWFVFEKSGASTRRFEGLNTTNASTSDSFFTPSSSTITWTGTTGDFNGNTNEYIMYCFHSVDGYQKVGSYSGTGASGNRIYTTDDGTSSGAGGFRPRFVMVKRTDSTGNWVIKDSQRDSTNPNSANLYPNLNNAENTVTTLDMDFNDDGFTLDGTSGDVNASGTDNYIYLAIA